MLAELPGAEALALLTLAALVSGLVKGFAGFGTAMCFLPIAGQVLPPVGALACLVVMDIVGPLPNLPRALRDGAPRDAAWLGLGLFAAMPLGVMLLLRMPPEAFRYAVSVLSLTLLVILVAGFRLNAAPGRGLLTGTGALGGLLGGVAGLPGPPVIVLYMSGTRPVELIRGTLILYLVMADLGLFALLGIGGKLTWGAVITGALLIVPFTLANMVGAVIFRPERARLYRWAAYGLIAGSAILGLPLLD